MERINDLVLWKTLNDIIGTREEVFIRRKKYFILDIVANLNQMRPTSILLISSGSKAEGLNLLGSDEDMMTVIKHINVEPYQFYQPPHSDLIMETNNVKPGFAKLVLGLDKRTKHKLQCFASALTPVENNRVYLSSLLFRDKFVEVRQDHCTINDVLPHGPCATSKARGIEFDELTCLRCAAWPYEANEWTQRRPINNWPSENLVQQIIREGCLLVPIGNPLSDENHVEWRISFSLAEKKLVHSMNHCQFLCYGLLKLYLKHVIDAKEDCKGLLCSYFLKTALFYSIEEDDVVWDQHNILNCFWVCFKRLYIWIQKGYMPNYFIKTNNMIESKIFGDSQRKLIEHLQHLYTEGSETVFRIPIIYDTYCSFLRFFTDADIHKFNELRCDMELCKIRKFYGDIHIECQIFFIEMIHRISTTQQISAFDNMLLKTCLAGTNINLTPQIYRIIVMSNKTNSFKYKQIRQLSKHILRNCTGHDICSGLLQYATLNFLTRKYSKVVCILKNVLTKFKSFVIYPKENLDVFKDIQEYLNHVCGKGFKIEHKLRSAFANSYKCLENCKFYPEEIEVQINEHKDKFCNVTFIPPKVYSYVLLFLTYHRTGNKEQRNQTLDQLCEATCDQHFINEDEEPVVSALFQRCVEIATLPITQ